MLKIRHKFNAFVATTMIIVSLFTQLAAVQGVLAACPGGSSSQAQILNGVDQSGNPTCDGSGFTNTIHDIITLLSYFVGIIAIIMIVISAIRFITSGGDSAKVSSAKSALIYALVGVAVAAVAQVLVHFVLTTSANNTKA